MKENENQEKSQRAKWIAYASSAIAEAATILLKGVLLGVGTQAGARAFDAKFVKDKVS